MEDAFGKQESIKFELPGKDCIQSVAIKPVIKLC